MSKSVVSRSFSKYVGSGNDFVLFDNRNRKFPYFHPHLVKKLCHRQLGIGADGIILLECSAKADVRMRIFNPNGSEAEMCGNGVRCFVAWLQTLGFTRPLYTIETMHRILSTKWENSVVFVDMGAPQDIRWNRTIEFLDQKLIAHHLNTGVPHLVIFVDQVRSVDVELWGETIRNHPMWAPHGVNVNFVQVLSEQKIKIRTFERGVEAETLSCGTGATAGALATAYLENFSEPIIVETKSGEELTITFAREDQTFSKVGMTGSAYCVFNGELDLAAFC